MKHTEVSCPEDIERLNDLEYFRLSSLPLDHPVRAHWQAAALRALTRWASMAASLARMAAASGLCAHALFESRATSAAVMIPQIFI